MTDPGPYYRPEGYAPGPYGPHRSRLPLVIGLVLIAVAVVIIFLVLLVLYPGTFGISPSPSPYRFGLFGGFFLFFFILIVVFFIVRVAFWSTRQSRYNQQRYQRYQSGFQGGGPGANRPLMVARMRYARGEITREQYEQIVKDLGRGPGSP